MQPIYEYLLSKEKKLAVKDSIGIGDIKISGDMSDENKAVIAKLIDMSKTNILVDCIYWETRPSILHIVYDDKCIYPTYSNYDKADGLQFIVSIDKLQAKFMTGTNHVFYGDHYTLDFDAEDEIEFLDCLVKEIDSIKTNVV